MAKVLQLPAPHHNMPSDPDYGGGGYVETVDVRKILGTLQRRKMLILGVAFVITSLAILYVNQLVPLYKSEALVVVGSSNQNVVDIKSVTQGIDTDYYTNATQAAIIKSRALAEKAVNRLNLVENPLYNYELRPPSPSLFKALKHAVKSWLGQSVLDPLRTMLGQGADDFEEGADEIEENFLTPEEKEKLIRDDVIEEYLYGLDVEPEERSHVIAIGYISEDPKMAALAANTTAELYILDQLESKSSATSKASSWLNERVGELRERVIESEKRLEEFRKISGIIELGDMTMYQQQLANLSEQLVAARNSRNEAEARTEQVQSLLESEGGIETAAAVLDSPLIQRLREQETEVVRKIAELETQFREGHPKMSLARNELVDLKEKIAAEVNKIIINQTNELEIAAVREANLSKEVSRLEGLLNQQSEAQVNMNSILSEVKANKQLYETFLERYKETDIQDESLLEADARVISKATVSPYPFYPRKKLMIAAAFVLSLVAGFALAFLAEYLDSGFRSLTQVESVTGQAALGMLPIVQDPKHKDKKPHVIAFERPNSAYGEAVRTLRTGLMLSSIDHAPRSCAITSAAPNEGKSTTSLAVACATAKAGKRAIIVDCDLRSPSLHEELGVENTLGLGDHLAGGVPLDEVIEIEPSSGVHYMTSGSRVPNPSDLLGSDAMKSLIRTLESIYDLVVFDMPPLLAVSDALVMARDVDKYIYVIRWEKTPRQSAATALRQLVDAGADIAGCVLSQVDVRKHAQYHYADSGYYQGGYAKYYMEE